MQFTESPESATVVKTIFDIQTEEKIRDYGTNPDRRRVAII